MPAQLRPWTVTRSERLLRDRWISLRADHCITAAGAEIAPYYVLNYPDWVHVVAIDADERLLMVEQYRHALGVMSLEVPGGGVDSEDADPLSAGRRELLEETGHGGGRWRVLTTLSPNPATHANRCHIVLAEGVQRFGSPRLEPGEELRLRRLAAPEAVRAVLAGEVIQAMHVAALAVALTELGRWSDR